MLLAPSTFVPAVRATDFRHLRRCAHSGHCSSETLQRSNKISLSLSRARNAAKGCICPSVSSALSPLELDRSLESRTPSVPWLLLPFSTFKRNELCPPLDGTTALYLAASLRLCALPVVLLAISREGGAGIKFGVRCLEPICRPNGQGLEK